MGTSVSLQGRFCHDMDPNSSILVSSLGYTEIIGVLSFNGAVCSKMCRVSDAWRSHTRSTIRVACIDLTLAVFSLGHRYYWVEANNIYATAYAKLNAAKVATFIISHIICRYGVPHELI